MKHYQRILICIKDPDLDEGLLTYAGPISRAADMKHLHLLHIHSPEVYPIPAVGGVEMQPPAQEITEQSLQALAESHFKGHGREEIHCEVITGTPLVEILRFARDREVDLIVMGRPAGGLEDQRETLLARRVTAKATCSVLVVPDGQSPRFGRILVPARNSECSANALEMACQVATIEQGKVICLNVFPVTTGYERVGTTLEQHTAILGEWADKECDELIARVDAAGAEINKKCKPDYEGYPVSVILDEIGEEAADIVVIGARGRSGAAGVLLGKVTEQLIRQSNVPILAVKKKGECLGVLDAILALAGR
jgi:nucleotide-binding universal stress UspA family protein